MSTTSSRLLACLALLLLLAPAARADEPTLLEKVAALERAVGDPDASWQDRWVAYRRVREALDEAKGPEKEAGEAAYKVIQADVAKAIRRHNLPVSGWIMGFFGASLLWGGLAFCIGVARKKGDSGGKGGG